MSQPSHVPNGLWQKLLPQAYKLMDEVQRHGGIEPFYTFGGGTVLMLRYDHRESKDIDFFVPDPQYLGYVTPRLSDVAEEMCGGAYSEAAVYVKLQLSEGEIDVVASPNLLLAEAAFEFWELEGRQVRVETAGEIVAKKMYHRGNQGTPRDLFDLAMVIEAEPRTLAPANPFFYRHLDVFLQGLANPHPAMKERFDAIDTRSYTPSFDHAVSVASAYLTGLQATRAESAASALGFANNEGFRTVEVEKEQGDYVGSILHSTERHVVQSLGRGDVVIHDLADLAPGFRPAESGKVMRVRYGNGQASAAEIKHHQERGSR